jgi:hypothetical protein
MRIAVVSLLAGALIGASTGAPSETVSEVRVHTEFLWTPSAPDSLARSWAQGLLMTEDADHQICIKLTGHPEAGEAVRIDVYDGDDEWVASDEYHHPGGPATRVRCRSAQTRHMDASPGIWTYRSTLGGIHESVSRIEVADDLANAEFYSDASRPYIVGRTNFTDDMAAHYQGEVVFDMTVSRGGDVVDSRIAEPDALPAVITERIHAAARRYRFPPDHDRARDTLTVRQTVSLSN